MVDLDKLGINYEKIIDSHIHLGVLANTYYQNYSDKKVIDIQKRFKVVKSFCSHCIAFSSLDRQMDAVEKASGQFGSHLYWYLIYNPNYPEKSIKIIDENKDKINFAGVKIHPVFHLTSINSKKYFPLWEYASSNNIITLTHSWSPDTPNPKQHLSNPLLLKCVLERYGDIKIILAHSGGKVPFYDKVADFGKNYENLYYDFAGDTLYPPVFRKFIDKVGADKILFGSDMPMIDIRYHILNIFNAGLIKEEREKILYLNAIKLFGNLDKN